MKDLFGNDLPDLPPGQGGVDELFTYVREFRQSERFRELLDFCAKFPSLAPYNALMVHIQKPGARFVLSAAAWFRRYNRVPLPNARPLVILWPFAPVQYWYDIGDTMPIPGKEELVPEEIAHPFDSDPKKDIDLPEIATLTANLPLWGIAFSRMRAAPSFSGSIATASRNTPHLSIPLAKNGPVVEHPARYLLSVREGSTPVEEFSAIAHELGHFFCAHLRSVFPKPAWQQRSPGTESEEFEAETVAWLICRRRGVRECRSYDYLSGYLGSHGEVPPIAVELVFAAVRDIEQMLERRRVKEGFLFKFDPGFAEKVNRHSPRPAETPSPSPDFELPLWAPR